MDEIARGTTPTLRFRFKSVPADMIVVCWMTVRQNGVAIIEKRIEDAITTETTIEWKLTQAETLKIRSDANLDIQCRWRLGDGTTGASKIYHLSGYKILKDGVI